MAVKAGSTDGILDLRRIARRVARGSAAAVVTMMTTAAAVSVGGMRPPVFVTLGRRPVVPGVGWV